MKTARHPVIKVSLRSEAAEVESRAPFSIDFVKLIDDLIDPSITRSRQIINVLVQFSESQRSNCLKFF